MEEINKQELYDRCKDAIIISNIETGKVEVIIWYTLKDKNTVNYYVLYGEEELSVEDIEFKEVDREGFKFWVNSFKNVGCESTIVAG